MNAPLPLGAHPDASLDDRYRVREGWVYLSGTQALVRLPLQQVLRDQARGHLTGGYISGYRGSPLGRYDMELWRVEQLLLEHRIHFRAAVNEDLAATAIWGAQYVGTFPGGRVEGVFGIWYGKGPGADRSGDPFRHANSAGTSPLGGVVALAGDDHGAKSSTIANFSDQIFIATGMPVLYPSNTQELLDFGLHGIAMSRYSGCWVGMKVVNDVIEGGGTIYVADDSPAIVLPEDRPAASLGPAGWHVRRFDLAPLVQEDRLYNHKLYAALAYARANGLNRMTQQAPAARLGLLAAGKAYQDTLQALAELGLTAQRCRELGIRVGKVGMIWPLDPVFVQEFALGLTTLMVVEEKRSLLETQVKSILYEAQQRPRVVGHFDNANEWSPDRGANVLPGVGELSPPLIARAIAEQLLRLLPDCGVAAPPAPAPAAAASIAAPVRPPSFCAGCPHNRSTKLPEGSRALAGIGCHTIAMLQNPAKTTTVSHMGGEGAMWLGQAPFTAEEHVFANMGDGTYFHSGFMAIRQAIAAKATMTYKLLVNGFVAMTGGQPVDGNLSVAQMAQELCAEGVVKLAIVSDAPEKYASQTLPAGVLVHPRAELEALQLEFRRIEGVSVIIYEQPCATERRRLRKRGKWPDPERRTFINAAVCEGCGDCGTVSNCLAIEPVETPFGRKREINQSSCNKDFTCIEGFCPSFVTVHGGSLRKPAASSSAAGDDFPALPEPALSRPAALYSILVTGIGGTGVVTIGQILGMAAHIDGLCCSVLDVTGLAQKYGAVLSHVRLAPSQEELHATRIAAGEADAVVGCDLVVTAGDESVTRMRAGRTRTVVASDLVPTSEFTRNPDWNLDVDALLARLQPGSSAGLMSVHALRLCRALLGDGIAVNMFMLGMAWQCGMVPLSHTAIDRAIELNGVAVDFSRRSFLWGRRAGHDLAAVEQRARATSVLPLPTKSGENLESVIARRATELTAYQNAAYAERYRNLVAKVAAAEARLGSGQALTLAVAKYYFKLLAAKDAYEVARLFVAPEFKVALAQTFAGDYRLQFHIGLWPFARKDPVSGLPLKGAVGPWLMTAFKLLATCRGLRGSWLDPWRGSAERLLDARLLATYESDIDTVLGLLSPASYETAVKLAELPEKIRGYGHVRASQAAIAAKERDELLQALAAPVARAA